MPGTAAGTMRALAERWLALTFETYPPATRRLLVEEKDPFHNPVGAALREGIPRLAGELLGAMDAGAIAQALEGIVRIRAVQDFSPSQAVGFVFLAKRAGREALPAAAVRDLEGRVDELALQAFDLFVRCREQIFEVRLAESRRRFGVLEKIYTEEGTVTEP